MSSSTWRKTLAAAGLAVAGGLGCLASAVAVNAAEQAQAANTASAPPDVTKLGPQVGDTVPDFALPDGHGETRTLSSLMGAKGLVLVFSRSADW